MTPDGILELVTKLVKTYPSTYGTYSRSEIEVLTETWAMALEDYEDTDVLRAFKAFLVSDQKGFPPAIGQIVARIPKKVTMEQAPSVDSPKRTELKRSSEWFPGSIEVGDPRTGEISYVKYEGYPYGEGDKGLDNENRDEAIERWMRNLKENEQSAWSDHGAVFGEDFEKWKQKRDRRLKRDNDKTDRRGGTSGQSEASPVVGSEPERMGVCEP